MGLATALQGSGHKGTEVAKVVFGKAVGSTTFPESPGTRHEKKVCESKYRLIIIDI